jgi:hypothetical protein
MVKGKEVQCRSGGLDVAFELREDAAKESFAWQNKR